MVLEYLRDQERKPSPELLNELGWSEADLRQFTARWQRLKQAAAEDTATEDRGKLDDILRGLGLRPNRDQTRAGNELADRVGEVSDAGSSSRPPAAYVEPYRAYLKSRQIRQSTQPQP
jgi:hypothetical protein